MIKTSTSCLILTKVMILIIIHSSQIVINNIITYSLIIWTEVERWWFGKLLFEQVIPNRTASEAANDKAADDEQHHKQGTVDEARIGGNQGAHTLAKMEFRKEHVETLDTCSEMSTLMKISPYRTLNGPQKAK